MSHSILLFIKLCYLQKYLIWSFKVLRNSLLHIKINILIFIKGYINDNTQIHELNLCVLSIYM